MKTFIFTMALIAVQAQATTVAIPQIVNTSTSQTFNLGDAARLALRLKDPTFNIMPLQQYSESARDLFKNRPNQLPMVVIADFNGDGLANDAAVMGTKVVKGQRQLVAYMLIANKLKGRLSYTAKELPGTPFGNREFDDERDLTIYLGVLEGKMKETLQIKQDVLVKEVYGSPNSQFFYYDNGAVREISTEKFSSSTTIAE